MRPLFRHTKKNKQHDTKKTIHRLLTQDARIIIPKSRETESPLYLNTNDEEKRGIFIIITRLTGFAYTNVLVPT